MAEGVIARGASLTDSGAEESPGPRRRLVPPPTRWQFAVLMVALLYLAGSVGYLLGSRRPARPGKGSFDALFVPLMQDHHRGGVHMATYAATHAESEFVRSLATRMARNQRIEVNELEQARARAGLPESPPGYEPAQVPASAPADPPDHH